MACPHILSSLARQDDEWKMDHRPIAWRAAVAELLFGGNEAKEKEEERDVRRRKPKVDLAQFHDSASFGGRSLYFRSFDQYNS